MHSKTHLICLAAGLRSDPLGGTYSTRETPAVRDRERVLKKVGQKVGDEKEKKEREKHPSLPKFDSSCCPPYFFVWVDAPACIIDHTVVHLV